MAETIIGKSNIGRVFLDELEEGTTYKRILAAVATALNAGTYTASDADKVSAFGVGVSDVTITTAVVLDTLCTGGMYRVNSPTGLPAEAHAVLVVPVSSAYAKQFASSYVRENLYMRNIEGGVAGSWYEVWNASTDGNGGQPPAPKPTAGGSSIGAFFDFGVDAGSTVYCSGSSNLSGTWAQFSIRYTTAGAFVNTTYIIGSGTHLTVAAGEKVYGWVWRIA